jgi:ditrans,polycis-polyprenyl diphosphate synthase
VTVYAFSLDNFKRSPSEVASLMSLAEAKLAELLRSAPSLRRHAARVRVLGALGALPRGVAVAAARVDAETASHEGPRVNICLAYTGREDMASAAAAAAEGVREGHLRPEDVTEARTHTALCAPMHTRMHACTQRQLSFRVSRSHLPRHTPPQALLEACLHTGGPSGRGSCPPVGLLVRTSGEARLSDFLLAQSRHALLAFTDVLWPDFAFRHMAAALLRYQRASRALQASRHAAGACADAAADAAADADVDADADGGAGECGPCGACADGAADAALRAGDAGGGGAGGVEARADAVAAALSARYGRPQRWRGAGAASASHARGCACGAEAGAAPQEPPGAAGGGSGGSANDADASRRRIDAFLEAREAARAAWVAAAAAGEPPPWPPRLPPPARDARTQVS